MMRRTGHRLLGVRNLLIMLLWAGASWAIVAAAVPLRAQETASRPGPSQQTAAADESAERYTFREQHDPNGIGKFYMGREIARVMGYGFQGAGARWLEREAREREERLQLLVKSLGLKPDMVVADIGAGSGVISMLVAEQLGEGHVLAVDIQEEMLARLKKNAADRGLTNIKLVKGTVKSPQLKPASVDLVIMVDVYHEFAWPYEMLLEISRALKPGGRVAFVEYRLEDPTVPIKLVHKMSEKQVRKEAGVPEMRLQWKETIDVLPRQHIVIFERLADEASDQARGSESLSE